MLILFAVEKESLLTVYNMHLPSRNAPQQPKKATSEIITPVTVTTAAAVLGVSKMSVYSSDRTRR